MCKRIFKFELQLSSDRQNIKFSRYCPKFHIFTNIIIFKYICNFLDPLLHPYKFYGRDVSGILFSIFASCQPLTLLCLFSSIFVHYKNFPKQSVLKYLINIELIRLSATKYKSKLSHGLTCHFMLDRLH